LLMQQVPTGRKPDVAEEQVRSLRTGAMSQDLSWGTHRILGPVRGGAYG
jgi:hypothetical protein